jgi:hypothetical protein
MTGQSRLKPRDELEPLSVRGRAAGLTVGACVLVSGLVLVWASWHALRCGLGGVAGQTICNQVMGLGGMVSMLGLALAAAGAGVLWRTGRRLVAPDASSGWMVGEGTVIAIAGVVIGLLIPTYHCPSGYEMTSVFHACRSTTQVPELILHPPTWIAWKFGVAAAAIVLGVAVARWRRLPWPIASVLTVAVVGVATFSLAKTSVGLPTLG